MGPDITAQGAVKAQRAPEVVIIPDAAQDCEWAAIETDAQSGLGGDILVSKNAGQAGVGRCLKIAQVEMHRESTALDIPPGIDLAVDHANHTLYRRSGAKGPIQPDKER